MTGILALTGPIYLAIAAGYAVVRSGLVPVSAMRAFGAFVITVALPALLFSVLSTRRLGEIAHPTYLLAYGAAGLGSMALVWWVARRVERVGGSEVAVHAMGASCPNSSFVGLPVLTLALPAVAGVAFGLNLVVENLLLIPLVLFLAERGAGQDAGRHAVVRSLRRLVTNPLVVAIVLGVAVSALGPTLPRPVTDTVGLFARASTGVALFTVGGVLVGVSPRGLLRPLAVITAGKLVVQPLLAWLALAGLVALGMPTLPPDLRTALVLSAGMPVVTIYPVVAQRFGHERLASAGLLASTALSFLTLTGWLAVLAP